MVPVVPVWLEVWSVPVGLVAPEVPVCEGAVAGALVAPAVVPVCAPAADVCPTATPIASAKIPVVNNVPFIRKLLKVSGFRTA